ncbi:MULTISPECIES: hypothetical protein [Lactococcus]|uniref:Uncharacterized protein n=1 Tax=Lactococcus lactis subsp. lactis TaxID=1360 RepID=A0A0V8E0N9_LACLL|nr:MULTISPECIES: hypothetical protein [Lactococcus]KSU19405.1 hypothetical protein M20_2024 [Lactococcus lactis subsp. lactis]MDR9868009.1 hypothetical protein [Lactococcus cremoris]
MLFLAVIGLFILGIGAFLSVFLNVMVRVMAVFMILMTALFIGLVKLYRQLRDFVIKTKEMGW